LDQEPPRTLPRGVQPPCAVAPDVVLQNARVGPYVSVGSGSVLEDCEVSHSIIGARSRLRQCRLQSSLVGENCLVTSVRGEVNLGDYCELHGRVG